MAKWVPIFQIIHISDLHVRQRSLPRGAHLLLAAAFPLLLRAKVSKGLAGCDIGALSDFLTLVEREATEVRPTWVVDTGDASTLGDETSIKTSEDHFAACSRRVERIVRIHGNHDAWPEDLPLAASARRLELHRQWLRGVAYRERHPRALKVKVGGVSFQLYTLNSIVHDRVANTFAVGWIDQDQHWRAGVARSRNQQLRELNELVEENTASRCVRILATHHPLVFPGLTPWARVLNRQGVADSIGDSFSLVLSGHTHALYPPVHKLHSTFSSMDDVLGAGQQQLVIGSASQNCAGQNQEVQILRFHRERYDMKKILLERRLCRRVPGTNLGFLTVVTESVQLSA